VVAVVLVVLEELGLVVQAETEETVFKARHLRRIMVGQVREGLHLQVISLAAAGLQELLLPVPVVMVGVRQVKLAAQEIMLVQIQVVEEEQQTALHAVMAAPVLSSLLIQLPTRRRRQQLAHQQ
jgi:hypothetical protein